MSKNVFSDDLMFERGICSLLGERLISEHFIIIDFDCKSTIKCKKFSNQRRELIGFASNDVSFYKAQRAGVRIVLDKKARVKDVLNFFLFGRIVALYKLKSTLTLREKETLLLLTDGKSVEDVAKILNVKENTVYSFRRNIITKLDIKNRISLLNYI